MDVDDDPSLKAKKMEFQGRESGAQFTQDDDMRCGLCDKVHGPGACTMTDNSTNLMEYRELLISSSDEPAQTRVSRTLTLSRIAFIDIQVAAIEAIDAELHRRGQRNLIFNQPRKPVKKSELASKRIPEPHSKQRNFQAYTNRAAPLPVSTQHESMRFAEGTGKMSYISLSLPPPMPARFNGKESSIRSPPPMPPSKRQSSPHLQEASSSKKSKNESTKCAICGGSWHMVKTCPVVTGGTTERYGGICTVGHVYNIICILSASRSFSCNFLVMTA